MKFEDSNYFIIDKNEYDNIIKDDKENIYLYHFICVKYMKDNNIEYMKIDNIDNLKDIDNLNVLVKYYVQKIHYLYECSNDNFEYGEPYFIFNVGYFYIGGFIKNNDDEVMKIRKLFEKYVDNYSSMHFPFNDVEYLSLNK